MKYGAWFSAALPARWRRRELSDVHETSGEHPRLTRSQKLARDLLHTKGGWRSLTGQTGCERALLVVSAKHARVASAEHP